MIDPALPEEAPRIDRRVLRQFAGLWLLLWSGLAFWQWSNGHPTRAWIFGAMAALIGLLGLARPESIRPFFSALIALTRPIGLVMTRVVLGLAFYGLFTPLALVFRLLGRDPLFRKRRQGVPTYWKDRSGPPEPRRYLRQA